MSVSAYGYRTEVTVWKTPYCLFLPISGLLWCNWLLFFGCFIHVLFLFKPVLFFCKGRQRYEQNVAYCCRPYMNVSSSY
jgi:hypothetical protein